MKTRELVIALMLLVAPSISFALGEGPGECSWGSVCGSGGGHGDGSDCDPGEYARGVDGDGNAELCTDAGGDITWTDINNVFATSDGTLTMGNDLNAVEKVLFKTSGADLYWQLAAAGYMQTDAWVELLTSGEVWIRMNCPTDKNCNLDMSGHSGGATIPDMLGFRTAGDTTTSYVGNIDLANAALTVTETGAVTIPTASEQAWTIDVGAGDIIFQSETGKDLKWTGAGSIIMSGASTLQMGQTTFGGLWWSLPTTDAYLSLPAGPNVNVNLNHKFALDTDAGQIVYFNDGLNVLHPRRQDCVVFENMGAMTDYEVAIASDGIAIVEIGCHCRGTCTTQGEISFEDRSGNAMTASALSISAFANNAPDTDVTTSADHFYAVGDNVEITGSGVGAYDAKHTISAIVDSDTFTIPVGYVSDPATGTSTEFLRCSKDTDATIFVGMATGTTLDKGEGFAFDTDVTPSPTDDEYTVCWTYAFQRQ
jgi:hypothetical protein